MANDFGFGCTCQRECHGVRHKNNGPVKKASSSDALFVPNSVLVPSKARSP